MKNFKFNIRLFESEAPNNTFAADLEPAISVDFVSRINSNIRELQNVLGIADLEPMSAGTTIKMWKMEQVNTPAQVGEGQEIGLTKIKRVLADTKELILKKYRRNTSAEAIQKVGRDMAINKTDEKLISGIQKEIKNDFYRMLATGTGEESAETFQSALSKAWAYLKKFHEDEDASPVYFVSADDVADYLGHAQITTQQAFGVTYIQDFLGLGTVAIVPSFEAGTVIATAKENLHGAYIPANSGDVARTFGLTSDTTGLVGMTHQPITSNATIDTLVMSGVLFYPEMLDGIVKVAIGAAEEPGETEETDV